MSGGLEELRATIAALPEPLDPDAVARLDAAFAALGPGDVDLDQHAMPLLRRHPLREWTTVPLLGGTRAHLSLFLLPAGTVIELHDHPGMHLWSRALLGRVEVEPWDWTEACPPAGAQVGRARPAGPLHLEPGGAVMAAGPLQGNLHALRCEVPSVLLDLFSPPYDELAGRPCRYWTPAEEPQADGSQGMSFLRQA